MSGPLTGGAAQDALAHDDVERAAARADRGSARAHGAATRRGARAGGALRSARGTRGGARGDGAARSRPGSTLRTEIPEGPPRWMRSDRQKVVKVLSKLLGNAYKFTRRARCARRCRCSTIWRDSPYRTRESAFRPPRISSCSTSSGRSMARPRANTAAPASGLRCRRQLARLLGGDIQLESAPQEGSSFVVEMPLEFSQDLQPAVALPG